MRVIFTGNHDISKHEVDGEIVLPFVEYTMDRLKLKIDDKDVEFDIFTKVGGKNIDLQLFISDPVSVRLKKYSEGFYEITGVDIKATDSESVKTELPVESKVCGTPNGSSGPSFGTKKLFF